MSEVSPDCRRAPSRVEKSGVLIDMLDERAEWAVVESAPSRSRWESGASVCWAREGRAELEAVLDLDKEVAPDRDREVALNQDAACSDRLSVAPVSGDELEESEALRG